MVLKFCSFHLAEGLFGVDVTRLHEVLYLPKLTPVPLAPREVAGLINLRSQILTVINLKRQLGLTEDDLEQKDPMGMVVNVRGEQLCLQIDKLGEILEVEEKAFEPTPETVQGATRSFLDGTYKLEKNLLLILKVDELGFSGEEL